MTEAGLVRGGLEAAGDVRAPAERDQDGIGLDAGPQHGLHRRLVAWTDHCVGEPADVAVAMADEVAQALAARVDDAVERIGRDPLAPHGILQARCAARRAATARGL